MLATRDIVTTSNVIPDWYLNKLLYWRDQFKAGSFDVGDIANEIVTFWGERGMPYTQEEIYARIGAVVGRSGRTIRYYAETAAFFSPQTREDHEELPFCHFVFARTQGGRWNEILEYASLNPGISEDGLKSKFLPDQLGESSRDIIPPIECPPVETGINQPTMPINSLVEPPASLSRGYMANIAINSLSSLIDSLNSMIDNLSLRLKPETTQRLQDALLEVRSIIPSIIKELRL